MAIDMIALESCYFSILLPTIFALYDNLECDPDHLCRYTTGEYGFNVTCMNVSATNVDSINKCLSDRFSAVYIFQLDMINCSLSTLPSYALHNIDIAWFHTTCPFSDFPTDILRNVRNLNYLTLTNTTFTSFPSDLPVVHLNGLKIVTHKIISLNTELWSFPTLLLMDLSYGALEELAKDAFVGTPDLLLINLEYNRLMKIHIDTLKPLKSVQMIILEGNHIHTVNGLFDSIYPEVINFSNNQITSVDNVFSRTMTSLKKLLIGKNPIQSISFKLSSVAPHLQLFDMKETGCRKLNSNFFHMTWNLSVLILDHNNLEFVPHFHYLKTLVVVHLNHNNIISLEGVFLDNKLVNSLFLSHNKISELKDSIQFLYSLIVLNVSHNVIKYLSNSNFIGLVFLETLDLSGNRIEYVESKSFSGLKNLKFLSLAGNRFSKLNSSLQSLFALKTLLINSTRLEILERDEFLGLTKLSYLNLNNNRIKSVNGAFQDLRNLEILNIAENRLATLPGNNFRKALKTLWLAENNQLQCDCRLKWMIQWLAETNYTSLKDNPVCHFPLRLRGKMLKELTLKDILEWPEDCPSLCYCECDNQGEDLYVRANCSNRNISHMPEIFPKNLRYLDLSGNELGPDISLSYNWAQDLIFLDMERNKITTLELNISESIEELKLARNLIKRFPWSTISNKSLRYITFANNPWICDCETVNFRKWLLSESSIFVDVNETKCGPDGPLSDLYREVITSLKDTDLCPPVISVYVIVAIGMTGFLVVAISMRLAYSRYHLYIKVWLYAHGYTCVKENDMDTEKIFDGLVSYHHTAEEFVFRYLTTKLEQEDPKFTLCIPERDILCGEFSATAEMKAFKDSKRLIVVLNEEYINDMYCMSIFHHAFRQSLKDKVNRVILLKLCNTTKSDDIHPELKVALESTNCISWEKQLFWERLRYVMPKKTRNPREGRNRVHPIHLQEF